MRVLAGYRLVQHVPIVGARNSITDFAHYNSAVVSIGHDYDPVALYPVREHVGSKSPIAAAVTEIPAFAHLLDGEADRVRANANGRDHFLRHCLSKNSFRFAKKRQLNFDHEFDKSVGVVHSPAAAISG